MLRPLGPAVSRVTTREAVRAGFGAVLGLGVAGVLLLLVPGVDTLPGFVLVAPFGATSVLIFAVPNSPLAQPWPSPGPRSSATPSRRWSAWR